MRTHPKTLSKRISDMDNLALLAGLGMFLGLAMAGAWAIARHPGQSGWTDVVWSYATGIGGVIAALAPVGEGLAGRRWLLAAMVGIWSLRLGTHILMRTLKGGDDARYAQLKKEWGDHRDWRLFWFLEAQAGAAFVLVTAILIAARNPAPFLSWSDGAGFILFLTSVAGEGLADRQLRAFAKDKGNRGKVMNRGLWSWSRHPNYFFEWLGWIAYPVIAIGPSGRYDFGWLALAAPALMYVLLVHVSGIPPTESHMERSRGAAFRKYRERINAFFPGPPGGLS